VAAARSGIKHLFLGHHRDDQVEGILLRLMRNDAGAYLGRQGMSESTMIPCCENMRFAMTDSGYMDLRTWLKYHDKGPTRGTDSKTQIRVSIGKTSMRSKVSRNHIAPSFTGGMKLHRPLLRFTKPEILAFCRRQGVKYFDDPTNFDPSLTVRNAIRHLRSKYKLPKALQAPSVLQLAASAQLAAASLISRGERILESIRIISVDLRSGRMFISVPPTFDQACRDDPEAGTYALARLASAVSPQLGHMGPTKVPAKNLENFLRLNASSSEAPTMQIQQALMQRLSVSQEDSHHTAARRGTESREATNGKTVWNLSRPPMRQSEVTSATKTFWKSDSLLGDSEEGLIPDGAVLNEHRRKSALWSMWLLWDNRYWIRVNARSKASTIAVRPYKEADVETVRKLMGDDYSFFQENLSDAAPGKVRYTLPVLTVDGQLAAFPTLNITLRDRQAIKNEEVVILGWEVCYRTLDQSFIKNQIRTIQWNGRQELVAPESTPRWSSAFTPIQPIKI
jgi:tRNA(Ile)-lysidine synthase